MELLIMDTIFGWEVIRNGKPLRFFTEYHEAKEYADYFNGNKKHRWGVPVGDYFKKTHVCKDCGVIKHSRKEAGKFFNHYTLDGIHYDVSPGCKYHRK